MKSKLDQVLLVNVNLMKPPVSPVGIDFLASMLKAEGYGVRFLDLAFEEDIIAALEREIDQEFLFVGISIRNIDDSFFATRDFLLAKLRPIVKKMRSLTSAPLVVGGVGYSVFPIAALEYCATDFGIQGDGEMAIVHLANAFAGKASFADVPGLISKNNGQYTRNDPIPTDLSKIDLTDRSTVDNVRYLREGGMVGFETKRGCCASCSYCADRLAKGASARMRKPEQVAREVRMLADKGVDHFQTCDSEFNIPPKHALEVCREFVRTGLGERVRWYAYMTPAAFDDELASLMKRAGCVGINFGADHINPVLLKVLGRDHTAESLAEARRLCRKYDLLCMFDLLLGAPGETPETLREVVDFMKRIDPDCVGAAMGVRLYPGTRLTMQLSRHLEGNEPGVYGLDSGNDSLLRPVYYLSPELGEEPYHLLIDLVGKDERFFTALPQHGDYDLNYNNNFALSHAIRKGERGTFWDILRRIRKANGKG